MLVETAVLAAVALVPEDRMEATESPVVALDKGLPRESSALQVRTHIAAAAAAIADHTQPPVALMEAGIVALILQMATPHLMVFRRQTVTELVMEVVVGRVQPVEARGVC